MPSASKPATKRTPKTEAVQVTEPVASPEPAKSVAKTERVDGEVFANDRGQIFRQNGAGLAILYSPVPASNPQPFQHTPEEYERLISEAFGDLTKIWPLA